MKQFDWNRTRLPLCFSGKHYVKSVRIWSYPGPYFLACGLNTERYSRMREYKDQNNSEYGHLLRSEKLCLVFSKAYNPQAQKKEKSENCHASKLVLISVDLQVKVHSRGIRWYLIIAIHKIYKVVISVLSKIIHMNILKTFRFIIFEIVAL